MLNPKSLPKPLTNALKNSFVGVLASLALLASSTSQAAQPQVWVYHAHWMGNVWQQYNLQAFGRVLFFSVTPDAQGHLERNGWPEQWQTLRTEAQNGQVALDPVLTILTPELFKAIFSNPESRTRLLQEVLDMLAATPEAGLHLDIEVFDTIGELERAGFRSFLMDLRAAMNQPPRRSLTAFASLGTSLFAKEDFAVFDAVVAQGYDLHWLLGPQAGPVAALDQAGSAVTWKQAGELLRAAGIANENILFSSPLFGYEWPTKTGDIRSATRGPGQAITFAPVPHATLPAIRTSALVRSLQYGTKREAGTKNPWYSFRDAQGWHQGWFDDAQSLAPRLEFVRREGYGGVAFFVLGYDGGTLVESALTTFSETPKNSSASGAPPVAKP
jgi:spore germination protein YaaH